MVVYIAVVLQSCICSLSWVCSCKYTAGSMTSLFAWSRYVSGRKLLGIDNFSHRKKSRFVLQGKNSFRYVRYPLSFPLLHQDRSLAIFIRLDLCNKWDRCTTRETTIVPTPTRKNSCCTIIFVFELFMGLCRRNHLLHWEYSKVKGVPPFEAFDTKSKRWIDRSHFPSTLKSFFIYLRILLDLGYLR